MDSQDSEAKEIVATLAMLVGYVAAALVYSTIYQVTVRLELWKCLVESLDIIPDRNYQTARQHDREQHRYQESLQFRDLLRKAKLG